MKCFLRNNSPEIQQQLEDVGIECCICCNFTEANWLSYSGATPGMVHGIYPDYAGVESYFGTTWEEEKERFLKDNPESIDCGTDIELFIKTIKDE